MLDVDTGINHFEQEDYKLRITVGTNINEDYWIRGI